MAARIHFFLPRQRGFGNKSPPRASVAPILPHRRQLRGCGDLADKRAVARVLARVARVRQGNPGDGMPVGEGVSELRVDYGPGYRVYLGQPGQTLVVLLCGGDKRTQARDIRLARQYWHEFKAGESGKL